jgi:exopolyphosphatase/guanosine-5'-triphosphate,3'-diphosphate pyrophosphatase
MISYAATSETTMPLPVAVATAINVQKQAGLALWMERVLEECDRASVEFGADPVHDLRVALRRCRSMADGLRVMDPDPAWKEMKKAGRQLFRELGELRDAQVMEEWVRTLSNPDDPVAIAILQFLAGREAHLKQQAAQALQVFDRKQWKRWIVSLPRRAARMRTGSALFKHLALERWTEAYRLHHLALRNRSHIAFHRLRIGLKRFRYIVENFLPEQHAAWSDDLKELQDVLGEVHDLDVLWTTALQVNAFPDADARSEWHSRISEERTRRVEKYRGKMLGKSSLWQVWRAELPVGKQIESAALSRLKLWASLLDPDFKHSVRVARLALQLYDGLPAKGAPADSGPGDERTILQVAGLLHDVGLANDQKGHHKATYNLIRRLTPPLGWSAEKMRWVGMVARYHRGAMPQVGQKTIVGLSQAQRHAVLKLAGILRLANAFDSERTGRIQRLQVHEHNGFFEIAAQGYSPRDSVAENVAAARHLLETVYRRPVMVKPLRAPRPRPAARS